MVVRATPDLDVSPNQGESPGETIIKSIIKMETAHSFLVFNLIPFHFRCQIVKMVIVSSIHLQYSPKWVDAFSLERHSNKNTLFQVSQKSAYVILPKQDIMRNKIKVWRPQA